jgi:type I restriction enzyme R subunit/putative DNA methylase
MKPHTIRERLRQLVSEKNQWSRPLTAAEKAFGFLGWHERGYLPHCDFPGLVQFITFRLADSMSASRPREWEHLLRIENVREKRMKLEEYLDRGVGECSLRRHKIAEFAATSLLHFHGKLYELLAWCLMPNHVHVLVRVRTAPLWKIVQGWKKASGAKSLKILREEPRSPDRPDSKLANAPIGRSALQSFWQREYWDTFMRDAEQQRKAIRYIENNPVKAKLCRAPQDWLFSSARFRDEYHRLNVTGEKGVRVAN